MRNAGWWAAVIAGAALALAACGGGSECDKANDAYNNLNKKVGSCQVSGLPVSFNKNTCDQNLGGCTDAEKSAMTKYFDCINNVPTCNSGNESSWTDAVNACQGNITISQSCAAALNPM